MLPWRLVKEREGWLCLTNVDYYSGLALWNVKYSQRPVYTIIYVQPYGRLEWPNIENKLYDGRIMRPATKYVGDNKDYMPMEER